ncbi:MAG: hypothetical protein NVSMB12_17660 [Acidimicrobiales bacterium]
MTDPQVSPATPVTPRMRTLFRAAVLVAVLGAGVAPFAARAATVTVATGTKAIHPGVQTFTAGSQCTANFVYTDGTNTYIGQAAHCSGTGGNTATDGCSSPTLPEGTQVTVTGASNPGVMVYNSWSRMQATHEADPNTCQYNDLALIKLDPADVPNVDPSVPHWGGPVGLNTSGLTFGQQVFSYGNSELRLGITQLSPKTGISNGDQGGGWSHGTTMVTPGIPGDSGSGLLDSTGHAVGVLSTVGIGIPDLSTNNWGDLSRELAYASAHGMAVTLVNGTTPFNPNALPIG